MSELSTLFCKVKITKPQLEKFLSSAPEEPELNNNWLEWWDSRQMHSKMDLTKEHLCTYNDTNNQAILDGWLEYEQAFGFSDYDETTEEWKWGMLFFSENYLEMLPMFAFIIGMEKYISESNENIAIVYPFFWGDNEVQAYIHFEKNKAFLSSNVQTTADINPDLLNTITEYLNKKWQDLSKNLEND
ncbi:hypothetical protein [Flavobacterium chilense]|uniref:Uncharacterized protein n=1 Tax=Flavobacterium chilense TaxID=946677 RepID=A0A1M7DT40_9FLAO|nr:hypothetical protein [Flavobacterium chilense]SHL82626.1 hypothetical protein SAMN05444484_102711 [Flavobacterium chilense]